MNKLFYVYFFMALFSTISGYSQGNFTLSGTIADGGSNETLVGASVYIKELETAVSTNASGQYSITLPAGTYTVQVSYVSFKTTEATIVLNKNIKKNFGLSSDSAELEEVVITQNTKKANIKSPEMSVNRLTAADIKKMPVVMGEVDVIKSLMSLPGVTNGGEGASGFNVRGGAADQNLILLDDATLFNSSHLFGFFSVFNSDAIKDLNLYKGGIPARYGGRVASVLDINQRDGKTDGLHATGGIGLISSRLVVEGPLDKNGKGSFLVGGRTSYAHLFLKLTDNNNSAYFYDLNMRSTYNFNDKNKIYLSGYLGRDVVKISDNFSNIYGNTVLNFGWNHKFSNDVSANLAVMYSEYLYGMEIDFVGFKWDSGITNYTLKYDFKHKLSDKLKLTYGASAIRYDFNPGTITPSTPDSSINKRQLDKKYAYEGALYLDANHELSDKLSVSYGLRYSYFNRVGSQDINIYENNQAVTFDDQLKIYEKGIPIGTKHYGSNESIANFGNLEPRASVSYQLNEDQSVKASYNRMAQYLHLISNTASATPLDVWAPSDNYIKPQILDQVALGYFRNFKEDIYTLETEVFYKTLKNRVDYIDGADLIANNAIEQVVLSGKARAYGLELLVRKNTGKLTGWVAYTLSRAEQKTSGRSANETGINNSEWYHTGYDKLHNLSVTGSYERSKKWSYSAMFALQSGQPVTYPNSQYQYGGINVPNFGNRNENRLPIYHHLDVSATYTPKPDKKQGWQGEWVFSIYNLYNRQNAASISFRQNADNGSNEAVRLSIFGVIPSVTYNFKF